MGWTNHQAKRPLAETMLALRKAEGYLIGFYEYVNDTHPEMGDAALIVGEGIESSLQLLLDVWCEAWFRFPSDLQKRVGATEDCRLL